MKDKKEHAYQYNKAYQDFRFKHRCHLNLGYKLKQKLLLNGKILHLIDEMHVFRHLYDIN